MTDQLHFADLPWDRKGKTTRREQFLTEMDRVIPWTTLVALIAPHYPVPGGAGRPPIGLETMLRIYFLQQWFDLSDPGAEEALYDSRAMRRFVGIQAEDVVPDESTILKFRHLLEAHDLPAQIFAAIRDLLQRRGLLVKQGTIVDATIIAAPSSTKNATQTRDPEMRQTRKGNTWYFGMKLHIGTDPKGIVHSLRATHAAAADLPQLPHLVHGEEDALYGDRAYWNESDRQLCQASGLAYRVNRRTTAGKPLSVWWRRVNRARSRIRARVEHPFQVVKRLWGFQKVRYRGLAKNLSRAYTAFALANLFLVRRRLLPQPR